MSAIPTGPIVARPPFPSGWSSLALSVDDLDLANVLPVGQSFLWHRHQLTISSTGAAYDGEGVSTIKSEDGTKEAGHGVYEEFSRAIDNPPRVILLRQSAAEEVIYYTSVRPDASDLAEVKPVNGEQSSVVDEGSRADQRWLHDYFNLDRVPDLPSLYVSWIRDDPDLFGRTLGQEESERVLGLRNGDRRGDVVEHMTGRGIRVLEQDPWECLIAFITSTNNHIPRIAGLMHRLCTHFSSPLLSLPTPGAIPPPPADPIADIAEGFDSALHDPTPLTTYHLFPSAASLAPVGEEPALEPILRELGFGYRAGFIASSLATLRARFGSGDGEVEKGLLGLRRASDPAAIPEVREVLLELKGIGRKVADCVMLMCLGQDSIIPIDTHVASIAARHPSFPSRLKNKPMSPALYDEVQGFLAERWGEKGGWAQAVMFALDLPSTTVDKGARGGGSAASTPVKTPSAKTPVRGKVKREDSTTPSKVRVKRADGEDELNGVKRKAGTDTGIEGVVNGNAQRPEMKRTRSSARLIAREIERAGS